jgi:hypothetical protein
MRPNPYEILLSGVCVEIDIAVADVLFYSYIYLNISIGNPLKIAAPTSP